MIKSTYYMGIEFMERESEDRCRASSVVEEGKSL